MVAIAGIGVCVFFKDEMGDIPGFEELWKKGLRCFAEDEEFGFLVEFGDGGREIVLTVQAARENESLTSSKKDPSCERRLQELPSVGSTLCSIYIVRIPREDWPETLWIQVESSL